MQRVRLSPTFSAAIVTVVVGVSLFLFVEILRPEERRATFDTERRDIGPLEAINGAIFPRAKGVATVTEPLAHVRLPFWRTLQGKQLVIRPRFHLDEGDVLEVGVKKTDFWLDYDRLPLQHRVLDYLLVRDERTWRALRAGDRIVYQNPAFEKSWDSVEQFEAHPPTEGVVGLYGNATLACALPCQTAPFRPTDDPDSFRALYAWYPEPDRSDPEWTVNSQRFDLSRAHQNDDGSIEVMFFLQRSTEGPLRLLVDEVHYRIEPGWPNPRDLVRMVRRNLVKMIKRPPPSDLPSGPG